MPKTPPNERWNNDVLERIEMFKHSDDLPRLREDGLLILGRGEMLVKDEWWGVEGPPNIDKYRKFQGDCGKVGEKYGLAAWTVEWICLMKDYDPAESVHVLEVEAPRLRVVTETDNELFLRWLMYEAWELKMDEPRKLKMDEPPKSMRLTVILQTGSMSTHMIGTLFPEKPDTRLDNTNLPPLATAFKVTAEPPPNYPPEAAAALGRLAANVQRELARRLGYEVPQRMRASSQTQNASLLRVGEEKIERGGIYGIVDEMYGEGDLSADQLRRNRTKNQRHQLRKRLLPEE